MINILFWGYVVLGLFFLVFNSKIGSFVYKLTLLFTDKMNLSDFFIFKIDNTNRDSFYVLTRSFSAFFGLALIAAALWVLY
jgi:hypothetical protein